MSSTYAIPSDMLTFFDVNTIGDLVSDTGLQATPDAASGFDVIGLRHLDDDDRSGGGPDRIGLPGGGIYSVDDLQDLTGNAAALLTEICCRLAMVLLVQRRPEKIGADYWQVAKKECEDFLDRLRKGERLFGLTIDRSKAGRPALDTPSVAAYRYMNLLTGRTQRFYPPEEQRLPLGSMASWPSKSMQQV